MVNIILLVKNFPVKLLNNGQSINIINHINETKEEAKIASADLQSFLFLCRSIIKIYYFQETSKSLLPFFLIVVVFILNSNMILWPFRLIFRNTESILNIFDNLFTRSSLNFSKSYCPYSSESLVSSRKRLT